MFRSPPNFSSYSVLTGAFSNKNGVRGTGLLDNRPCADHRVDHVDADHGKSGGRGVMLAMFVVSRLWLVLISQVAG